VARDRRLDRLRLLRPRLLPLRQGAVAPPGLALLRPLPRQLLLLARLLRKLLALRHVGGAPSKQVVVLQLLAQLGHLVLEEPPLRRDPVVAAVR